MTGGGGDRGGRYGGSSQSGGGEQILPQGGGSHGVIKKRGLLTAVSEIQQYFVMERGQDIPGEFLTIEGSIDYFKIGAKSGFSEGLILFLLYPVMEFYVIPFVLKAPPTSMIILFTALPFFMIAINTMICGYVSKYYIGKITRKAINNLFVGRSMSLIFKGALIYILYFMISKLGTPKNTWALIEKLDLSNGEALYYNFLTTIQPHLIPAGTRALVFLAIGAIGPYGMVYGVDAYRQYKIKRNMERVSGKAT